MSIERPTKIWQAGWWWSGLCSIKHGHGGAADWRGMPEKDRHDALTAGHITPTLRLAAAI
jgi:hypothetical protein